MARKHRRGSGRAGGSRGAVAAGALGGVWPRRSHVAPSVAPTRLSGRVYPVKLYTWLCHAPNPKRECSPRGNPVVRGEPVGAAVVTLALRLAVQGRENLAAVLRDAPRDAAFPSLLADVHDSGLFTAAELAAAAGLSRSRLYVLLGEAGERRGS